MTTKRVEPQLEVTIVGERPGELELSYALDNPTRADLLVCNRLPRGRTPDGVYQLDPNLVYVSFAPGPVPHLTKRIPDMGDDVDEEHPVHPCATRLEAGGRLEERIVVSLPIRPFDAYRRFPPRDPAGAEPSRGLVFSLGWIEADAVDPMLLGEVVTTAGRLPLVKIHASTQHLVQAFLDVSVPVLPASTGEPASRRICVNCGATNVGDNQACLRCGTALPPPAAARPLEATPPPAAVPPPGGGWRPTHRVPAGGMPAYTSPDLSESVPLAADLPVEVVDRSGEWARIVVENGWTAWVDGRLLVAVER